MLGNISLDDCLFLLLCPPSRSEKLEETDFNALVAAFDIIRSASILSFGKSLNTPKGFNKVKMCGVNA